MKTKQIGIVLTSFTEDEIEGIFAISKAGVEVDDLYRLTLIHDIDRANHFRLNLTTGIYETSVFCDMEMSKKIGRELKKIGFENVKLRFNGKIHKVEDL